MSAGTAVPALELRDRVGRDGRRRDAAARRWLADHAVALVTAIVIELSDRWFSRQRLPAFYQQVAGAFVAMAVAIGLYAVHAPVKPSLVVAAGIIMLLAGIALTGAVQDALTGYYVTAAARSLEAMLLSGGIIAGHQPRHQLGIKLGLPVAVDAQTIQPRTAIMAGRRRADGGRVRLRVVRAAAGHCRRSRWSVRCGSLVFTLMARFGVRAGLVDRCRRPSSSASAGTRSAGGPAYRRWSWWSPARSRCCRG